jgi:prephenate dehydratase
VVPFENSTNGSVVYTLDLFCDRHSAYLDIYVCGEVYVDIHHNLLGRTDCHSSYSHSPATAQPPLDPEPRSRFSHIHHIYSHPQAFGQCEAFLTRYLKHSERHEVSSTSKAAEIVSLDETGTSAAISSAIAAEEYGLDVLAPEIEDRSDNTTRFLIIRKGNERSESPTGGAIAETSRDENGKAGAMTEEGAQEYKSLVSFTIDHQSAGALADALLVFKTNRLNLTSINSRPSQALPWHYIFLVEFEGSEWGDPQGAVKGALRDLGERSLGWRWFGSWRDQLK